MFPNGEIALAFVRAGFLVTPLGADGSEKPKAPFLRDWPRCPYSDRNKKALRERWEEANYNVGLVMGPQPNGRHLVAIDIDVKEGALGDKSLANLELLGLQTDGTHTITPSGGRHFFYWTDRPLKSPRGIMPGVDIRCEAGQVVAPGSTIDGKAYTKVDGNILELPAWMADIIEQGARTHQSHEDLSPLVEWDKPENIRRAVDYLANEAPEAIEGQGGNDTTFKVMAHVKDFGISSDECDALMLEHYNETKAVPPWAPEDLQTIRRSVYKNGSLPPGIADASGELGNVVAELSSLETTHNTKQNKLFWLGFQDSAGKALSSLGDPLVKGLLNRGGLSAIYGRSNSGKSFIVLNLEFHIAKGIDWQGRKVKKGLAIHLAAEGGQGFHKRTAALKKHHNTDENIPLVVVPCPINLLDKTREGDTHKLIALIKEIEAAYGMPAEFISIDTLSRALAGGDENAATDMGVFVQHIDKIRAATGAHVMLVHHSGKDQARGMRGWSGMQAAIDTEIEIHEGVLKITKQRDIEPLKPFKFQLKQIEIGQDQDGDQVTSCVVEIAPENEFEISFDGEKGKLWKAIQGLTDKRRHNKSKDDKDRCILLSFSDIHDAYNVLRRRSQQETADKTYVSRLLKQIVSTGCLQKTEDDQWHM